jgi:hypothetical protein
VEDATSSLFWRACGLRLLNESGPTAVLLVPGFRHKWWLAGAVLPILAALLPQLLRRPKRFWRSLASRLSLIGSPMALGVLFFGIITPAGLLLRLFGRDPLRLKPSARSPTYWIERSKRVSNMKEEF